MAGNRDPGLAGICTLMNIQHIDPTTNTSKVEGKFLNAETSTIAGTEIDHDKDEINKLHETYKLELEQRDEKIEELYSYINQMKFCCDSKLFSFFFNETKYQYFIEQKVRI